MRLLAFLWPLMEGKKQGTTRRVRTLQDGLYQFDKTHHFAISAAIFYHKLDNVGIFFDNCNINSIRHHDEQLPK